MIAAAGAGTRIGQLLRSPRTSEWLDATRCQRLVATPLPPLPGRRPPTHPRYLLWPTHHRLKPRVGQTNPPALGGGWARSTMQCTPGNSCALIAVPVWRPATPPPYRPSRPRPPAAPARTQPPVPMVAGPRDRRRHRNRSRWGLPHPQRQVTSLPGDQLVACSVYAWRLRLTAGVAADQIAFCCQGNPQVGVPRHCGRRCHCSAWPALMGASHCAAEPPAAMGEIHARGPVLASHRRRLSPRSTVQDST